MGVAGTGNWSPLYLVLGLWYQVLVVASVVPRTFPRINFLLEDKGNLHAKFTIFHLKALWEGAILSFLLDCSTVCIAMRKSLSAVDDPWERY